MPHVVHAVNGLILTGVLAGYVFCVVPVILIKAGFFRNPPKGIVNKMSIRWF